MTAARGRRLLAAAGGASALALAGCGGGGSLTPAEHGSGLRSGKTGAPAAAPAALGLHAADGSDLAARLDGSALVRDRPGGTVVARVGARTEFGSPDILPVVRRRPGWLGVVTAALPNGRIGWIAERKTTLVAEPVRVRIALGRRELVVTRGATELLRMRVAVGAPGTPTPTGRFAVTDGLSTSPGSPYGCCVLALSGHQPSIPQGWTGGDRIAVHGTTDPASIGAAVSHGCLRGSDADLRRLLRVVTLGARVEIVA